MSTVMIVGLTLLAVVGILINVSVIFLLTKCKEHQSWLMHVDTRLNEIQEHISDVDSAIDRRITEDVNTTVSYIDRRIDEVYSKMSGTKSISKKKTSN